MIAAAAAPKPDDAAIVQQLDGFLQQQSNNHANSDGLVRLVRQIKNAVIGNRTRKLLYAHLGVVSRFVRMLASPAVDVQVKQQVAVCLGSLAYGDDLNIENLVQSGAIPPLLEAFCHSDRSLAEAAARALKAIYQHPSVPRDDLFREKYVKRLVQLVSTTTATEDAAQQPPALANAAASILARCCETMDQQNLFHKAGIVGPLIDLLYTGHPKSQEAALDALGSLSRENTPLAKAIMNARPSFVTDVGSAQQNNNNSGQNAPGTSQNTQPFKSFTVLLVHHLRDKRPEMRLIACTCLANMCRAKVVPADSPEITTQLMPTLVKLFADPSNAIREKAPMVLAALVNDNEQLQQSAADADAVNKLVQLLTGAMEKAEITGGQNAVQDRLLESALLALTAIGSLKEECRKAIIDAKILGVLVKLLESRCDGVRAAACMCTRSLSRSVKTLRTSLVDAGVTVPLFKLLSDESVEVQSTAAAALCNIVLDFSPMKKTVLENGGVEKLAALVGSMDNNLRLNAVWALKNLLYQAEPEIKQQVTKRLTYNTLIALLSDAEVAIQEQSLNLLRNLVCGKEQDIQDVFEGMSEATLMQVLESKLAMAGEGSDEVVVQALYTIVNVATGTESHKGSIMKQDGILKRVLECITHNKNDVRVAAIWVVINLTWPEDGGSEQRGRRLRQLGFEDRLRQLTEDPDTDVRDRVKTALQHFQMLGTGNGGGHIATGFLPSVDAAGRRA